jgi:ubiquitin-protein ligase
MQAARMKREMTILSTSPPAGISCYPAGDGEGEAAVGTGAVADTPRLLHATVLGTPGTVNEGGVFRLDVTIPAR